MNLADPTLSAAQLREFPVQIARLCGTRRRDLRRPVKRIGRPEEKSAALLRFATIDADGRQHGNEAIEGGVGPGDVQTALTVSQPSPTYAAATVSCSSSVSYSTQT
jgi:hypothetical protein